MNEQMSKIIKNPAYVGLVSLGIGLSLGYILGKKNGTTTVHVIPPMTSDELRETEEPKENIAAIGAKLVEERLNRTISQRQGITEEDSEPVPTNIFGDGSTIHEDTWDYEEEVKNRTPTAPYVLHKDEFFSNERDYAQLTLTYYAGDEILCDEDDVPVFNHSTVVGDMPFGHGSGDPKVVYIRNDIRKAEYEIVHDDGLFSVEVHGLELENNERVKDIRHSHNRKFRPEE